MTKDAALPLTPEQNALRAQLSKLKLIVCCGAGGVGKTTTSAALALAGARLGLNVLALTIDPSKRLAQTLGVARNTPEPIMIDRTRLEALGVPPKGCLSAWLLDPQLVSDRVVDQRAGGAASSLKSNLIYREISGMVAGMQEYTAVEALHAFIHEGRYDLIILDTPPSRHALRFIDSPQRVAAFLDKRIFQLFVPKKSGVLGRVAARVLDEVLDRIFGEESRRELKQFFELFSRLLDHLNGNQAEMERVFKGEETVFYLVTTARTDAFDEAKRFAEEVVQRGLNLGGFLLNRCLRETDSSQPLTDSIRETLEELADRPELVEGVMQVLEARIDTRDRAEKLQEQVATDLAATGELISLYELTEDASTLEGIRVLTDQLVGEADLPPNL